MEPYKERMLVEYYDLSSRIDKLDTMLNNYKCGSSVFDFSCPVELLEKQLDIMKDYLHILEVRADIENVPL